MAIKEIKILIKPASVSYERYTDTRTGERLTVFTHGTIEDTFTRSNKYGNILISSRLFW